MNGQPIEPSPHAVEIAQEKRAIKTGWGDAFTQAPEKFWIPYCY